MNKPKNSVQRQKTASMSPYSGSSAPDLRRGDNQELSEVEEGNTGGKLILSLRESPPIQAQMEVLKNKMKTKLLTFADQIRQQNMIIA